MHGTGEPIAWTVWGGQRVDPINQASGEISLWYVAITLLTVEDHFGTNGSGVSALTRASFFGYCILETVAHTNVDTITINFTKEGFICTERICLRSSLSLHFNRDRHDRCMSRWVGSGASTWQLTWVMSYQDLFPWHWHKRRKSVIIENQCFWHTHWSQPRCAMSAIICW